MPCHALPHVKRVLASTVRETYHSKKDLRIPTHQPRTSKQRKTNVFLRELDYCCATAVLSSSRNLLVCDLTSDSRGSSPKPTGLASYQLVGVSRILWQAQARQNSLFTREQRRKYYLECFLFVCLPACLSPSPSLSLTSIFRINNTDTLLDDEAVDASH